MNKSLMIAYYLKKDLKEIWMQGDKEAIERTLDCWLEMAWNSKIPRIIKLASTLSSRRIGILAWYDYYISTGKIEGISNNLKTMKRQAYGYREQEFFELKYYLCMTLSTDFSDKKNITTTNNILATAYMFFLYKLRFARESTFYRLFKINIKVQVNTNFHR